VPKIGIITQENAVIVRSVPGDVKCKDLALMIFHYNQLSTWSVPNKTSVVIVFLRPQLRLSNLLLKIQTGLTPSLAPTNSCMM
jgi:hypothetical protein